MDNFKVQGSKPYPLGTEVVGNDAHIAAINDTNLEMGVILTSLDTGKKTKISFDKGNRVGDVVSMLIKGIDYKKYSYTYYRGNKEYVDPFATKILGNEVYGITDYKKNLSGGFDDEIFDWSSDKKLNIPYNDMIIYLLHVRGFTAHPSSKVKAKGTFKGIQEKIPYLVDLGINAIELMPCYEFEEVEVSADRDAFINSGAKNIDFTKKRLIYWGFKEGYYFAPKASYAFSKDPCRELRETVLELHKNGIEVIMQLYFPDNVSRTIIGEVMYHFVYSYHIDGFHLKGNNIPIPILGLNPLFSHTKIMYDYIPYENMYGNKEKPKFKNMCIYSDEFMYKIRRYLKGDEDMLQTFLELNRRKNGYVGNVNFITNYYGFTLNDLVSYDKKHNEDNGEKNNDGSDYNYSWNCGVEGKTKKPLVNALRKRMIKNAFSFVLLSQGVPLITAGDELMNTQNGNNNPYCQDNDITHIKWNMNKTNKEVLEYVKELIKYRKSNPIFHKDNELTMLDVDSVGFPDLSYHGQDAWRADINNYNRHVAIMYTEKAFAGKKGVNLTYIAYNMYWDDMDFALPKLPSKNKWNFVMGTEEVKKTEDRAGSEVYILKGRSVAIFTAFVPM